MRPSAMAWRPLSLLLITETFPPEINGVARTLGRWVDTFRARGHQVQLIRPRQPNEKPLPEHVHGVPLPFYPQMRFGVASPIRLRAQMERYWLGGMPVPTSLPFHPAPRRLAMPCWRPRPVVFPWWPTTPRP